MHRSRYSATTPNNCIVRSGASLLAPLYIYIYISLSIYIYIYTYIYIYIQFSFSLFIYIYIYLYIQLRTSPDGPRPPAPRPPRRRGAAPPPPGASSCSAILACSEHLVCLLFVNHFLWFIQLSAFKASSFFLFLVGPSVAPGLFGAS